MVTQNLARAETEGVKNEIEMKTETDYDSHIPSSLLIISDTYVDLGKRSGITPRHISRVLKGEVSPRLETLHRLARSLNVDLESLVTHIRDKQDKREKNKVSKYISIKLSDDEVSQIQRLKGSKTTREVADDFDVSRQTVSNIWK